MNDNYAEEYITKATAQEVVKDVFRKEYITQEDIDTFFKCMKAIKYAPTTDVVEVIRCKDCMHNHTKSWNQGKRDKPSCRFTDLTRSNEFYCGFGERVNT